MNKNVNTEDFINYIGCKIIKAKEMTYGQYRITKYGSDNSFDSKIPNDTAGYMVIYPPIGKNEEAPYFSWSPKEVFEICYREIEMAEESLIFNS